MTVPKQPNLSIDEFTTRLQQRLTNPLPGRDAQRRFLPELSYGRYFHAPPKRARQAAVMMLHYPDSNGEICVPFTLRPDHLKDHAGQICFPGGAIEANETFEEAAVRELHEELDIHPTDVRVIGRLTPIHVFASGFYVVPIVGVCTATPNITPSPDEVAELVPIPTSHLVDPANHGKHPHAFGEKSKVQVNVGHVQFSSHIIWGATAIMLGEQIAVLNDILASK